MRPIRVKAACPTPQHEAVVFFASTVDEQLYDLTDDSFKAPALNTFSRTLELQSIARANHAAGIGRDALIPFVDELEWSVAKDPALDVQQRSLAKLHLTTLRESVGEPDRIARSVSGLRIVLGDYFLRTIETIKRTVLETPSHKADLTLLASNFVVQAETHGFPRRHTYHVAQNSLVRHLRHKDSFDPSALLDDFFSGFGLKTTKFDCVLLVRGEFLRFPKLLQAFRLQVSSVAPTWSGITPDQQEFLDSRDDTQHFVRVEKIVAASPALAHEVASRQIEEFVGVVRVHQHKLEFSVSSLSLVRDDTNGRIYRIRDAPDPMHCWVTHTSPDEEDMLALVKVLHGKQLHEESANRLQRMVRLHRSALESGSAENQLIDLWASLEGLLAKPTGSAQRIDFFSESLLPSLILSYPEKLFNSTYRGLRRVVPATQGILDKIPGSDSHFSRFVRLTLCAEHTAIRSELIDAIKVDPLLMNRVWRISQLFKDRETIQSTLRAHRQKVKWHLARIYFTRNSIMHSAMALPYLPTLVENLHVYIDTLIRAIQKTAGLSPERLTIEGALQYLSSWEKYRLHSITHEQAANNAPLTDGDVWAVVFGRNMGLAPTQDTEPVFV
jgi:hypothetical protein